MSDSERLLNVLSLHLSGTSWQESSSLPSKLATFLMRPVKRSFESEGEIVNIYIPDRMLHKPRLKINFRGDIFKVLYP